MSASHTGAVQVAALQGGVRTIDRQTLERFQREIQGSVAFPGDAAYKEATRIWNAMVSKRPALVIRAAATEDVARTIAFAHGEGVELSVRGGGHNIAGLALSDGGLTLDLSLLRSVDVDVDTRTATVGPGCTLGDVDRVTQQYGLAATLGFVSETGVAGLTLGGGFGYLTRQFGWTVDNLERVEIVTADGRVVTASRDKHDDLFWALRGGGGNFGVVTEFVFRLHEIGPDVTAGIIAWSADEAEQVLRRFHELTQRSPRSLTSVALMRNAPPAPWLPPEHHGKPMVGVLVNHTGSEAEAADDLAAIRSLGTPWADLIQRKRYVAQQSMLDATQPKGMHYYWKSEFLPGLSDALLDTYRAQFDGLEAPANQIILFQLEGALNEHDEDDGAVGNRDAAFVCVIQALSPDRGTAEANREWVRAAWESLKAFSTGGNYVNFQTPDEGDERVAATYRSNLQRLAEIKKTYDPENFFRVNRNIRPR